MMFNDMLGRPIIMTWREPYQGILMWNLKSSQAEYQSSNRVSDYLGIGNNHLSLLTVNS